MLFSFFFGSGEIGGGKGRGRLGGGEGTRREDVAGTRRECGEGGREDVAGRQAWRCGREIGNRTWNMGNGMEDGRMWAGQGGRWEMWQGEGCGREMVRWEVWNGRW